MHSASPKLYTTTIKLEAVNTPVKIKCTLAVTSCKAKRAKRKVYHENMKVLFVDNLFTRNLSCRRFD